MTELGRRAAASKALCASRITPDSFLFRHDQRGGRQLRLAADQKSCLAPALVFCRFRRPRRTSDVSWQRSVILFSGLDSAQGVRRKESFYTGGWTTAGDLPKWNNKNDRREWKGKIRAKSLWRHCVPLQNKDTCAFHAITIQSAPICLIGPGSVIICLKKWNALSTVMYRSFSNSRASGSPNNHGN